MAASTVSLRTDIPTLNHHFRDNAVEQATLVTETGFSSREFAKVAGGHGADIIIELEDDSSGGLGVDYDVKVYVSLGHCEEERW